jgi:uncharacterized RDD family membrane protein YckC
MSFAAHPRGTTEAPGVSPATAAADRGAAESVPPQAYVGLITRAIAFALDAALINAVAIVATAVATLTFSIVTIPESLRTVAVVAGGALYLLWTVGYFVTFWTTTGQTPGNRAMRIRVHGMTGEKLRPRRALLRFVGLTLAALPLFAGFLLILLDDRRRGLHDRLAGTVVIEAEPNGSLQRPGRVAPGS